MFNFRQFSVKNEGAALKVGTDAVLLGAAMTLFPGRDRHLLDIGTGSGVIALMAAQRLSSDPAARICGIDIDAPSIDEAGDNFAASPWPGMLEARLCRLQEYDPGSRFDLIFSNPPFYDGSLENPDARLSAARHELSLSLRDIASAAERLLAPDGRISIIIPADRGKEALRIFASYGYRPFRTILVRTTAQKPPKRLVLEMSAAAREAVSEELVLQNEGKRTLQYASLTEDFYL